VIEDCGTDYRRIAELRSLHSDLSNLSSPPVDDDPPR
jgi:hypothetical protein